MADDEKKYVEQLELFHQTQDPSLLGELEPEIQEIVWAYARTYPQKPLSRIVLQYFRTTARQYLPMIYHPANTCWVAASMWFMASMTKLMHLLRVIPLNELEPAAMGPRRKHRGQILDPVNMLAFLSNRMSQIYPSEDERQPVINNLLDILPCVLPPDFDLSGPSHGMMAASDNVTLIMDMIPAPLRKRLFWTTRDRTMRRLQINSQQSKEELLLELARRSNRAWENFMQSFDWSKSSPEVVDYVHTNFYPFLPETTVDLQSFDPKTRITPSAEVWIKLASIILRRHGISDINKITNIDRFWNAAHGLDLRGKRKYRAINVAHKLRKRKSLEVVNREVDHWAKKWRQRSAKERRERKMPGDAHKFEQYVEDVRVRFTDPFIFLRQLDQTARKFGMLWQFENSERQSDPTPIVRLKYVNDPPVSIQSFLDDLIKQDSTERIEEHQEFSFINTEQTLADWRDKDYLVIEIQLQSRYHPRRGIFEPVFPRSGQLQINDRLNINGETYVLNAGAYKSGGAGGGHWWTEVVEDPTAANLQFVEYDDMNDTAILRRRKRRQAPEGREIKEPVKSIREQRIQELQKKKQMIDKLFDQAVIHPDMDIQKKIQNTEKKIRMLQMMKEIQAEIDQLVAEDVAVSEQEPPAAKDRLVAEDVAVSEQERQEMIDQLVAQGIDEDEAYDMVADQIGYPDDEDDEEEVNGPNRQEMIDQLVAQGIDEDEAFDLVAEQLGYPDEETEVEEDPVAREDLVQQLMAQGMDRMAAEAMVDDEDEELTEYKVELDQPKDSEGTVVQESRDRLDRRSMEWMSSYSNRHYPVLLCYARVPTALVRDPKTCLEGVLGTTTQ